MNKRKEILVLGGGFGGVYAARKLSKTLKDKVHITVLDMRNYFLFTPLLHEVAAGTVNEKIVVESIPSLLNSGNMDWKMAKIDKVLFKEKKVLAGDMIFDYDYLVVAMGSSSQTFGTEGVEKNAFFLKNLADAIRLKNKLIESFQIAVNVNDTEVRKKILSVTIIGAGATGIELAGEISDFIEDVRVSYFPSIKGDEISLNIINSGDELLPNHNKKLGEWCKQYLRKLDWNIIENSRVKKIDNEKVYLADGVEVVSSISIWTAGVKPNLFESDIEIELDKGRIKVDDYLKTQFEGVYALGDIASGAPMLAQVAVQQASVVAYNLSREILGSEKKKSFKFNDKGSLLSVGKWNAVGQVYGIALKGWPIWILWHLVYFSKYVSNANRFKILMDWIGNVFRSRDISKY